MDREAFGADRARILAELETRNLPATTAEAYCFSRAGTRFQLSGALRRNRTAGGASRDRTDSASIDCIRLVLGYFELPIKWRSSSLEELGFVLSGAWNA